MKRCAGVKVRQRRQWKLIFEFRTHHLFCQVTVDSLTALTLCYLQSSRYFSTWWFSKPRTWTTEVYWSTQGSIFYSEELIFEQYSSLLNPFKRNLNELIH
jgi:hypothetical protein